MPRAQLPRILTRPEIPRVDISDDLRRMLAPHVPNGALTNELLDEIGYLISMYKASVAADLCSSIAETRELLMRIVEGGPRRPRALQLLLHEGSSVDADTQDLLGPYARRFLQGEEGALEQLSLLAEARINEIAGWRVEGKPERLAHFCGVINVLFQGIHGRLPWAELTPTDWIRRRKFALGIFDAGEVKLPDFDRHPERLDLLLETDVIPIAHLGEE